MPRSLVLVALLAVAAGAPPATAAELSSEELAKLAQNHIFHLGKLPVNAQIGGYYNVVRPDFGPNWQIRAQVQFMFPK